MRKIAQLGIFPLPTRVGSLHVKEMPDRSRKPPKDTNAAAKRVVDIATGDDDTAAEAPPEKDPAAVSLGRRGGLKGGRARAEKLTPEQRAQIARTAAAKRWQRE